MTDQDLNKLIQSISDSAPASIKLHTNEGRRVQLDCVYKKSTPPGFQVVFKPGIIPENVDIKKPCALSFPDVTNNIPAFQATIARRTSDRSFELIATTTIDPSTLRDYFRVDLQTRIVIRHEARSNPDTQTNWSIDGQTLDLSGSGVLGLFPAEPKNKYNIFIEISLTHPEKTILCLGHVVRTRKLRKGNWHIALHFDNISSKNRDAIITNCLWEQRRQLRERIQVN